MACIDFDHTRRVAVVICCFAGCSALTLVFVIAWPSAMTSCPTYLKRWGRSMMGIVGIPMTNAEPQWFSLKELARFNGNPEGSQILLAVGGEVFDVTFEARFYGPNGAYGVFAAQDSTRALSRGSLDQLDWKAPKSLDLSDFRDKDWDQVVEQVQFYREKYQTVGGLIDGVRLPHWVATRLGGVAEEVWRRQQSPTE